MLASIDMTVLSTKRLLSPGKSHANEADRKAQGESAGAVRSLAKPPTLVANALLCLLSICSLPVLIASRIPKPWQLHGSESSWLRVLLEESASPPISVYAASGLQLGPGVTCAEA
jgi:hypothetical protein